MQLIKDWIESNYLDVNWDGSRVFTCDGKIYLCLNHKSGKIFNDDFSLIVDELEQDAFAQVSPDYFVFSFGGKVYYTPSIDNVKLNPLKYIGKAKGITGYNNLGVHGPYEICSGSRDYDDWCKKANFMSVDTLGIVEKHTLAGALKFQGSCEKARIKSIIGETVTVRGSAEYIVKLYVASENGWGNLLRIHKNLHIDNANEHVSEDVLLKNSGGLYMVFCSETNLSHSMPVFPDRYGFNGVYYQLDTVKYRSEKIDLEHLNRLKNYFNNFSKNLPLALICDSYYLDQEENNVRKILHKIKGSFHYQSTNQYFKCLDDIMVEAMEMFSTSGDEWVESVIGDAIANAQNISDGCSFKIPLGKIHLPKYQMTKEESEKFNTNEDLFWDIIGGAIEKLEVEDKEKYVLRIEHEYDIISRGGFVDYFLTLRDVVNWSENNGVMVGTGRGSAGSSLIAMLMNITKVDPIEYGLIFERFLNESRIGKGLPDIDIDFASGGRERVKQYMEERFGKHNVCSIGTYNAMKTKSAFRELIRLRGEQPQTINYYASIISESNEDMADLFREAIAAPKLKDYFDQYIDVINNMPLILGQPKSSSIHAAGVIVTPNVDENGREMQIYDWFPCKLIDGVLISEWEGTQLDDAGFLKADILGLSQLDKLSAMLDLIEARYGDRIDLNLIDKDDKEVFDLFKRGLTQDVFQFGTDGLSVYCREVQPESIVELATMNALYRPGPMDAGAHTDYVKIKFGKKEPEYDWGCDELLKSTHGLLCFQEQAIRIVQHVGGFTLTEGDGVRKATGKKILDKMQSYKEKFVAGAVKKGCPEYQANIIWNKIELFAGYSFNLSHAVEYSLIGYQTQWLKNYFPLEFWTVSLQYAKDDEVHKRIHEMNKFEGIRLSGPDVNKSGEVFYTDWETNTIYWSLPKIKQIAEKATNAIVIERERGQFYSLEEFVKRLKGKSVDSRAVKHLIFSGAFDSIYNITSPIGRKKILDEYCGLYSVELEYTDSELYSDFFWYKQQKELSGFGFFDYSELVDDLMFARSQYVYPEQVQLSDNLECHVVVAGMMMDYKIRKTRKGEAAKITLENNNDTIDVMLWNDAWDQWKDELKGAVGKCVMLNGKIQYDGYHKKNAVYSSGTIVNVF